MEGKEPLRCRRKQRSYLGRGPLYLFFFCLLDSTVSVIFQMSHTSYLKNSIQSVYDYFAFITKYLLASKSFMDFCSYYFLLPTFEAD